MLLVHVFTANAEEPCATGFGRAADGNCYPLAGATPPPAPAGPAAPPATGGKSPEYWLGVNRRARTVATTGWIVGGAGTAVLGTAFAIESGEMALVGLAASVAGPPLIAGASLRSAHAVRSLGGSPTNAFGAASWGAWGAGVLLMSSSAVALFPEDPTYWPMQIGGLACHLSSFALGGLQLGAARHHLRELHLTVTPIHTEGGASGIAWAGRF